MAGWAPFAEKYTIHAETYEQLKRAFELGGRPYYDIGVEGARKQSQQFSEALNKKVDFPGKTLELVVPSPHEPSGIPITVYQPAQCANSKTTSAPPILIYYHGGGMVIGSRHTVEPSLQTIARDSGAIVVNVEYRLLPNKATPCAPLEDGVTVARWVLENRATVGGADESRVGVGGDSSGGHIAAATTNSVRKLAFQVLVYPVADLSNSQSSHEEFRDSPVLNKATLTWFAMNSLVDMPDALTDPNINPMARADPETTPPTLIVLAELDALRGSGQAYAERLRGAGVDTRCEMVRGVPHGFFQFPGVYKQTTAEAFGHIVAFLKEF